MEHEEASRQLFAFLDGELTPAQQLVLVKHLAACPFCRRRLEYEASVKALVAEKAGRQVAPPGLRQQIITKIEELEARPSLWQRLNAPVSVRPLFGLGLAALLMIVALIPAFLLYSGTGGGRAAPVFEQLASKHAVFGTERNALEVAGGAAEIAAWYTGKGDLAFTVPQPAGLELLGARLSDLHHARALQLIYESKRQYVSLFLFKSLDEDFPASRRQTYDGEDFYTGSWEGYNIVLWRLGEMGYALVAHLERDQLLEMAHEIRMEMMGQEYR